MHKYDDITCYGSNNIQPLYENQQDRQCSTINVALKCVLVTIVVVEKQ
jgi:hypothetical protein